MAFEICILIFTRHRFPSKSCFWSWKRAWNAHVQRPSFQKSLISPSLLRILL